MWLTLSFLSALGLGIYEINKKKSLERNAVIPVLTFNTLFCSLIFLGPLILSRFTSLLDNTPHLYIPSMNFAEHGLVFIKAIIVLSSWLFAYFATKHLPLTYVGPIKATQPMMTLMGALLIFGERLNLYQWAGVLLAIGSLFLLSRSGKKEGIRFVKNKWILYLFLSAVAGAASGLYDKFLMKSLPPLSVQSWYNIYQLLLMLPICYGLWYPQRKNSTPFQWRWSIPLISLFLAAADYVYFFALAEEGAMISIVSMIRRSSVVVTFLGGALLFREKQLISKGFDLLLILTSMLLLYYGSK